ncbi:response regulator transcription factor [Kitasatospora sp. NPDC048540]|uniref:response regulator transcription factor n=1 Tax=unclassified Kitasatospora TaxID=2633591 RepID=UPI000539A757|nr:response regulator transcription factor [Kitasatospora sp. MBT63]
MIRILLAEDMNMVRGALVALLGMEPDIEVVSEVDHGDQILPQALAHRPDIAVLDIDLPGVDGLTAATMLRERLPSCRALILTSLGRPGTLRRAMAAKVSGFILKDAPPEELAKAIRKIASGERVIDPQLAMAAWDSGDSPLTNREVQVLRMAAQGAEVTEIAAGLFLSAGTVRNYLTNIVTKLNARNRVDAIRIADEAGWLS